MQVTTVMVSEAPNVAPDSQHMTVPVRLIRSGIRVVVKITSTVSGSLRSIPNTLLIPKRVLNLDVGGKPPPDPRESYGARADQEVGGVGLASGKTVWHGWRPWLPRQQQRLVVLQLFCCAGELKGGSHRREIVVEPGGDTSKASKIMDCSTAERS